jgi:hypothetical protein
MAQPLQLLLSLLLPPAAVQAAGRVRRACACAAGRCRGGRAGGLAGGGGLVVSDEGDIKQDHLRVRSGRAGGPR